MNRRTKNQVFILSMTLAVSAASIAGYALFGTVLRQSEEPVLFELFAALIGVSITITLTSMLLKRQASADLKKEESIILLGTKMNIYIELIDQLKEIINDRRIDPEDLIEIRLLNQKLAFVCSQEVLQAFTSFSRCYASKAKHLEMDDDDVDHLLRELSILSFYIRKDILNEEARELEQDDVVRSAIIDSNQALDIE